MEAFTAFVDSCFGGGTTDMKMLRLGIKEPNLRAAGAEIVPNLPLHVRGGITGRDYLNGEDWCARKISGFDTNGLSHANCDVGTSHGC